MTSIIVVVFDGLNTELVTPEIMPNLHAFAQEGVQFNNHRPVFPSVTRLNASAMVTGCFPGRHGLHANLSLVPEFHPTEPMDALEPQLTELRRRTGQVLFVPTLADILAEHGREYIVAGVGTTGQAFLHHPNGEDATLGATIHNEFTLPRHLHGELVERFGEWPAKELPNTPRIRRVTDLFLEYVLGERQPEVALMWFSEPDSSEHGTGPGSPVTQQAVRDADAEFGRLLAWLAASEAHADTNVVVTCDHGQTTVIEAIALQPLLDAAGFAAPGEPGGVVVAGNGGSALFYIEGHDAAVADRLAAFLMTQPWCGPILAGAAVGPIEGTLPADLLGLEGPRTPDLLMSFAWTSDANEHGAPGMVYASGSAPGRGTHGSMSPWEFRTFSAARGPAFRSGSTVEVATGHADWVPTFLRILDLPIPAQVQGSAIEEALVSGVAREPLPVEEFTASRMTHAGVYTQRLRISRAPGLERGGHLIEASASLLARIEDALLEGAPAGG